VIEIEFCPFLWALNAGKWERRLLQSLQILKLQKPLRMLAHIDPTFALMGRNDGLVFAFGYAREKRLFRDVRWTATTNDLCTVR
jgi:hypothetical protein